MSRSTRLTLFSPTDGEGARQPSSAVVEPADREQGCKGCVERLPHHSFIAHPMVLVEGYVGMAIAGGAAAVGAILLAGLIRRATRK